ncbi:MAG: N-acetyl-gamma-glutamyl-phosphate reductase [Actinomycetota bacterium]
MKRRAAVLGASGFAGGELLRLLGGHPDIEVVAAAASKQVGRPLGEVYPWLRSHTGLRFVSVEEALANAPDIVFCSLPHGHSMEIFSRAGGPRVVDLGGDFRLHNPALYPQWFGREHAHPELLDGWVYGLTEWHRPQVRSADRVANPGCYPAACILALAPLLAGGSVRPTGIHIDAKSGVSGAGRAGGEGFDFSSANENLRPYSVTAHQHIAEIEQELSEVTRSPVTVSFVPHLVPMTRGLLATCIAELSTDATSEELIETMQERYGGERFIRVLGTDALPETRRLSGTNRAEVSVRVDPRTGRAIAICALDNLGKGAAGQALQNANLMLGFDEDTALSTTGMWP